MVPALIAFAVILPVPPSALLTTNEFKLPTDFKLELITLELKVVPEIKSVIITGAGLKSFVAGADIKEFRVLSQNQQEISNI